jgi:Membrane magnesium transporter
VIFLCLAAVFNSTELKPVNWREWTNLQEHQNPGYTYLLLVANNSASNILEHRPGFIDIRAKRKAFLEKKGQGEGNPEKKPIM